MLTVLVRKKYLVELASGRKQREYRRYGPRFNERVFHAGREVRFVCEYRRRVGWVVGVVRALAVVRADQVDVGLPALRDVYPTIADEDLVAVIDLDILEASIKLGSSAYLSVGAGALSGGQTPSAICGQRNTDKRYKAH